MRVRKALKRFKVPAVRFPPCFSRVLMRVGGVEVWCSPRSSAQGFSFDAIRDGILLHVETDFRFWRLRWG